MPAEAAHGGLLAVSCAQSVRTLGLPSYVNVQPPSLIAVEVQLSCSSRITLVPLK